MSAPTWAAVAVAGLAAGVGVADPPARALARRLASSPERRDRSSGGWQGRAVLGRLTVGGCGVAALVVWVGPTGLLAVPLAGICWLGLTRLRAARTARKAALARSSAVREVCEVLAAELRAGRTPDEALVAAPKLFPELGPAVLAGKLGADVPAAVREIKAPGATGALHALAAAWSVADRSGAGLAVVLDRLTTKLRADEELREEVSAQLAAPRATARVVATLPLAGLGLGLGLGADPLAFLVGTPVGLGCLLVGAGLVLAGLAWVERLARRAEERP